MAEKLTPATLEYKNSFSFKEKRVREVDSLLPIPLNAESEEDAPEARIIHEFIQTAALYALLLHPEADKEKIKAAYNEKKTLPALFVTYLPQELKRDHESQIRFDDFDEPEKRTKERKKCNEMIAKYGKRFTQSISRMFPVFAALLEKAGRSLQYSIMYYRTACVLTQQLKMPTTCIRHAETYDDSVSLVCAALRHNGEIMDILEDVDGNFSNFIEKLESKENGSKESNLEEALRHFMKN